MAVEMLKRDCFEKKAGRAFLKRFRKKDEDFSCFDSSYAGSVR